MAFGAHSRPPCAVGQLRCAWSPVPAPSSLRDRRQALFSGSVSLLLSQWNGSETLPYLTGWLTLNLFIESKAFFWISMVFCIQRITNMIANLV